MTQLSLRIDRRDDFRYLPHQQDCFDAIADALRRGVRRQLIVMFTGGGKTSAIASGLPSIFGLRRMVMLAHMRELVAQAAFHLCRANPGKVVDIERADYRADPNADFLVASVPTIGRQASSRIRVFRPDGYDAVVVDEAHHANAPMFLRTLQYFGCGRKDGPLLIGITATGFRNDGQSLSGVFDEVVYEMDLKRALAEGLVVDVRVGRVKTQTDISEVPILAGDFRREKLAEKVNTDLRNEIICSAIEDHMGERRSIVVFGASVDHVHALTEAMQRRGMDADCVTAKTSEDKRAQILGKFQNGKLRILVNFGITIEGWDCPRVDGLVMARPTKSTLLYTQMLGRGVRHFPGKNDLLVLDVVDIARRHSLISASEVFGLRNIDLLFKPVSQAIDMVQKLKRNGLGVPDGTDVDKVEAALNATQVNGSDGTLAIRTSLEVESLLGLMREFGEIEKSAALRWLGIGSDHYFVDCFATQIKSIELWRDRLGDWKVRAGDRVHNIGTRHKPPFVEAEKLIRPCLGSVIHDNGYVTPVWKMLGRNARWRSKPPTPGQIKILKFLGIGESLLPRGFTRGAAADIIGYYRRRTRLRGS